MNETLELIISGYSPGHQLLKKIAEELRTKRTYDLDNASLDSFELPPQYKLGKAWIARFILRHPHLKVAIGVPNGNPCPHSKRGSGTSGKRAVKGGGHGNPVFSLMRNLGTVWL